MSETKGKGPIFDPGLCRCCGCLKKCRILNVEYESLGQKEIYSDMLLDCFGLMLSHLDGKPTEQLICATCVTRLRDACSFRHQVLLCEEAFLQIRNYVPEKKAKFSDGNVPLEQALVDGVPKIEVELIKTEPCDYQSDHSVGSAADADARSHMDHDDSNSNDDIPLSVHATKQPVLNETTETLSDPTNNNQSTSDVIDSVLNPDNTITIEIPNYPVFIEHTKEQPFNHHINPDKNKISTKKRRIEIVPPHNLNLTRAQHLRNMIAQKHNIPMSKVQQLIKERDPTYMTETNILSIVEYSFVCPFKCRHNHLLCFYCGEHFSDPELLRSHTWSVHSPKKFKITEHKNMIKCDLTRIDCRLCAVKIDNLEEFKVHLVNAHSKKYYFDHKDLVLPFRLTKADVKCALCNEIFPYFHALNKHMNEHFSNYVCETCGLGFVDKGRFVMHQQRHDQGDFPCETCGRIFKAEYNRDLHIDRVHKKRGRVYCPKCDVKLMSYPQKLKHLVEVHGEQPLSFPCSLCDKVCETRRMLTIHWRKDHLKDFRYDCEFCGQKFFTRFALTNHMPTHTGERNFKCKVCEKSYPRLKTLKDHMKIHTNDRRYRCHICGQAFIQNCSLKGHMKSQHPEYG